MIPFQARERENEHLGTSTFGNDPTLIATLEAVVADYHGRRYAVAFGHRSGALGALFSCYAPDEIVLGAMGPAERFSAASHHFRALRYAELRLDGTLFNKMLARALGPHTALVVEHTFGGIEHNDDALRASLGDTPAVLDACGTLAPLQTAHPAVWSPDAALPAAIDAPAFVLTDNYAQRQQLTLVRGGGYIKKVHWNYDLVVHLASDVPSALAADITLRQVRMLDETADRLRERRLRLYERLKGHYLFDLPTPAASDAPACFSTLLTPPLYCPKEAIFTQLIQQGIEAAVCCKPVYKTTAYKDENVRLDITEDLYKALLQLPCHHRLTLAEIDTVAENFLAAVETYAHRGCRF